MDRANDGKQNEMQIILKGDAGIRFFFIFQCNLIFFSDLPHLPSTKKKLSKHKNTSFI
jgi:hypothetical protein